MSCMNASVDRLGRSIIPCMPLTRALHRLPLDLIAFPMMHDHACRTRALSAWSLSDRLFVGPSPRGPGSTARHLRGAFEDGSRTRRS